MDDITRRQLIAELRRRFGRYELMSVDELVVREARGELPAPAETILEHLAQLARLEGV